MGLFTIDRTINFSEEKVKKVLNIISSSSSTEEIENKMVAQGVVNLQPNTNRHGFFRRRWVTFLKDFDLYDGQKLTEMGQLFLREDLSTNELLLLLLIRRTVLIDGKLIRPFEQILRVANSLLSLGFESSITKIEFEKYVALIGLSQEWDVEFVTNLIIDERQGKINNINSNPGNVHFDIWKNLMITAGLSLESDDIRIDFTNPTVKTILTFFDEVKAEQIEFGIFNDSFIKYINIGVNIRNSDNVLLNDSLIKYQGIIKSKLKYSNLSEDAEEGCLTNMNENLKNVAIENELNLEEGKEKVLPILPKRVRKLFELNSILYGAPGTGKTYATAKYALAIVSNKPLENLSSVPREEIMKEYNALIKEKQVVFTTFHQNYGYEDFIQGIRPDTTTAEMRFKTVDGVFKQIAEKAMDTPEKDFVIIIDEINRANISKVFGELITLIEDDKRWGEENAVSVTLPSGEIFAVPNNLYIVGTMNSADKSISLIDTALRRRFEFVEFIPDLSLIADSKLKKVLKNLNEGISKELNSTDLLVGHSYFINKNADDICTIMNRSIIPLLYEYFFDNKNKVEAQLKSALEEMDVEIISNTMGRIKIQKKVQ
jgi:hypothetical protein